MKRGYFVAVFETPGVYKHNIYNEAGENLTLNRKVKVGKTYALKNNRYFFIVFDGTIMKPGQKLYVVEFNQSDLYREFVNGGGWHVKKIKILG